MFRAVWLYPATLNALDIITTIITIKSVVLLAGAATSMLMVVIYIHNGGTDYHGESLYSDTHAMR